MKLHQNFEKGTAEHVFYHGLYQMKRGRNPSMLLMSYYTTSRNPREAFALAKSMMQDCSKEEKGDTIYGRPFLRSEIDWEKKYQQHLAGPHPEVSYAPTSGVDECKCSLCFYRDAPKHLNPSPFMKRLILAAILLFPVATLVCWFYWGSTRPRIPIEQPAATNAPPAKP